MRCVFPGPSKALGKSDTQINLEFDTWIQPTLCTVMKELAASSHH